MANLSALNPSERDAHFLRRSFEVARRARTRGNHPENPTLNLPCRDVFASGQRATEVVGPLLEDEAAAVHAGVWNK